MSAAVSRIPLVDALKAIACLMIVLHHLAAYGPMSDVAYPLFPGLIDWFYQYGRMAVQAFFVMAGFLVARKFAPSGRSLVSTPIPVIAQRYVRLVSPYLAALTLAIGCAAVARELISHDSIPGVPSIAQLVTHALLLQDLLDQEALSAGVWYIAIDFQLFALTAILLWLSGQAERRWAQLGGTVPLVVAGMTAVSLLTFNRDEIWDETALYFFGSYGLGMLSYWASGRRFGLLWLALLGGLVVAALLLEFRDRIALAGVLAIALGLARQGGNLYGRAMPRPITYLGRISFSVFLVHFPLLMIVNAAFFLLFPSQPVANAYGLLMAIAVSILGGAVFHTYVESRPFSKKLHLLLPAGFLATGLLAAAGAG